MKYDTENKKANERPNADASDKTALKIAAFALPFNICLAVLDILYAEKVTDNIIACAVLGALLAVFGFLFFIIKRGTKRPYLYNVLTLAAHIALSALAFFILYSIYDGWEIFMFIATAAVSVIFLFILLLADSVIKYVKSKR